MMVFVLMVVIALGSLVIDMGYVTMSKAQMQATADAAALAGGTELMPGLGLYAWKTPEQVAAAARPAAVQFAAANRAGEVPSAYLDAERDVLFGKAVFDNATAARGSERMARRPTTWSRRSSIATRREARTGIDRCPCFSLVYWAARRRTFRPTPRR